MAYLASIDDALDILINDGWSSPTSETMSDRKGGVAKQVKEHVANVTTLQVAGRTFHISFLLAPGITHTVEMYRKEIARLVQARMMVGERSVSLLPGSYKLWKNHLFFCTSLLEKTASGRNRHGLNSTTKDFQTRCNDVRIPPYLITSSNRHTHFAFTQAAYERSLVRLHKMPSIWLHYAAFVSLHCPQRNPTTVRRIYDRALLSLPATQHDRIWDDYLTWATGILPSGNKKDKGESWQMFSRMGTHKVKYGVESPLVAEWRKRGWGYKNVGPDHSREQNETLTSSYQPAVPTETALRILRRYFLYDTSSREDLAIFCVMRCGRFGEAASLLLQLLNNEEGEFLSNKGTTRHELWLRFAQICTSHPREARVAGVDFDGIIRAVLKGQYVVGGNGGNGHGFEILLETSASSIIEEADHSKQADQSNPHALTHRLGEMEGTLWTRLAEYHIRAGDFELARSVYEEALDNITRVRDFSLVFDAYVKFEEGVIEAFMELMEEEEDEDHDDEGKNNHKESATDVDNNDVDILLGTNPNNNSPRNGHIAGESADIELAISRAEHLTSRRPLLLNRVLLRQNPHNVGEWIKRSQLYLQLKEVDMATAALEESLKAVNARKSVNGSPCSLILTLVDILENQQKNVDGARQVLERICLKGEYEFWDVEDLAQCHTTWVELELRQEKWDMALELARRATSGRLGSNKMSTLNKAARELSKSSRLWNLLFDLEESLGTVQTTKDAYDRALEIKVATPSHVLNYASFLKDQNYFEQSFAALELGMLCLLNISKCIFFGYFLIIISIGKKG